MAVLLQRAGAWLIVMMAAGAFVWPAAGARYSGKVDESAELFSGAGPIPHLRIEIGEAEMDVLRRPVGRNRNSGERPSVNVTVRAGDMVWTNVALHLKGSLGSFRPVDSKPALTLNFDKHVEKQRFHGLEKISLNNSVQDPSFLHEKICREIFNAAGVPVPRVDYATVELNGRNLGLYVLAEGWNKQFLKRHFPNTKGNFYDLGGSHDVNRPKPASMGNDPTNHLALEAVGRAATETDHARRITLLRESLDLDGFISLQALDVLMWNWDGYCMNRNNYRMFHDLKTDRLVFLPHGLDQMFWKPNGPIVTGRSGLVAKSILETAEGRQLYLARFRDLRSSVIDVAAITNRIAVISQRLRPALMPQGTLAVARQQQVAGMFAQLIAARIADVDAQLASVKNFAPIALNTAVPLTHWAVHRELGHISFEQTTDTPGALRLQAQRQPSFGAWKTTLWLEEGRYRIEGRVKTQGVESQSGAEGGAGFRVWSDRKDTRGASWGWFPYSSSNDPRLGGVIPVFTNTPQQRLTGNQDWKLVTHEFELRQPLADVQIQCVLQAQAGSAWFDLSSLKIRRVAQNVTKSSSKND